MENKNIPESERIMSRTEKVVEIVFGIVLLFSGLCALYSLIWANWPVFQLSVTIFVTVCIGIAFGFFMANYFEKIFRK